MVTKITVKLNKNDGKVYLDDNPLSYDSLYEITKLVIDNEEDLVFDFHDFDESPDLKLYYSEIFESINNLKNDAEINELKAGPIK